MKSLYRKLSLHVFTVGSILFLTYRNCDCQAPDPYLVYSVNPDVIDESPSGFLEVTYSGGLTVNYGNLLPFERLEHRPALRWDFEENTLYTVIILDADFLLLGPYLLYLATNVKQNDLSLADIIFKYEHHDNIPTGIHRLVFLVYSQSGNITDITYAERLPFFGQLKFYPKVFAMLHGLVNLTAGNFCQAH